MISTQPYKGSRDFYPQEMRIRDWFFGVLRETIEGFGFEKIDAPILEPLDIYLLKTSQEIVQQQLYSFDDRGGRKVAIRPEMTPTVSRMVAGRFRELIKPIRWYSLPNLWRYERPGRGRLREHWQLNVDIFGAPDELAADLEIIQAAVCLMRAFGAKKGDFRLNLNHRGLLNGFLGKILRLNPANHPEIARALDKKHKLTPENFEKMLFELKLNPTQIKKIDAFMEGGFDFASRELKGLADSEVKHLRSLLDLTEVLGLSEFVHYDPTVVRGFDYYTGVVFEVFDTHAENTRSIFGGGRYDHLISHFAKTSCNAVGFGMGDVTFENFLRTHELIKEPAKKTQVYVASFPGEEGLKHSFRIASQLREAGLSVEVSLGEGKLKKQFQEADQKKIRFVVLQGEEEMKKNVITMKDLSLGEQKELAMAELIGFLKEVSLDSP